MAGCNTTVTDRLLVILLESSNAPSSFEPLDVMAIVVWPVDDYGGHTFGLLVMLLSCITTRTTF